MVSINLTNTRCRYRRRLENHHVIRLASAALTPFESTQPTLSRHHINREESDETLDQPLCRPWFAAVSTTSQDQHCELMHPSPRPFAIESVLADLGLQPPHGCGSTITPEMQVIGATDQRRK